jgi:hypothetical protein
MRDELGQSLAFLPCCSESWIWITKPSESGVDKFVCRRSVPTSALSVEGPAKNKLCRTIFFSSHPSEPMVNERGLSDTSPGNDGNEVIPVRGVMSARSLPGCPVLLMDVKTGHWIG